MLTKVKSQKLKVKSNYKVIMLLIVYCLMTTTSFSQCAMCRAALESEGNNNKAAAVNDGIVYLMVIPYLVVGFVGFFIYRMYYKKK